jgi:hypothetical protein
VSVGDFHQHAAHVHEYAFGPHHDFVAEIAQLQRAMQLREHCLQHFRAKEAELPFGYVMCERERFQEKNRIARAIGAGFFHEREMCFSRFQPPATPCVFT